MSNTKQRPARRGLTERATSLRRFKTPHSDDLEGMLIRVGWLKRMRHLEEQVGYGRIIERPHN